MVKEILGDVGKFAIEYRISDSNRNIGNVVFYLNKNRIGFFGEEAYLNVVFVNMKNCIDKKPYFKELVEYGENELEEKFLNSDDSKYDTTFISFGDTFDDFLIRGFYIDKENIRILFRLFEDSFYSYENLDNKVHYFDLDSNYILEVINNFETKVNSR